MVLHVHLITDDNMTTDFFSNPNHGWDVENGRLTKTFTVADADKFISDIWVLGSLFQHDADQLDKLDSNTVKVALITHDPREITTRDDALANSINLLGRNQEELGDFEGEQRMQTIAYMLSDFGLPTKQSLFTGEQRVLLSTLLSELRKIGKDVEIAMLREAQQQPSTETLGTPEVQVAPALQGEIEDAINRIKQNVDPNYFKNVSRIDIMLGGPFGQVSSDDPAVVKVNLSKVKQEVKRQLDQESSKDNVQFDQHNPEHQKIFDEVLTRALIEVVSHEKGHVEDFQPKVGPQGEFLGGDFPGGEAPAEQEASRVKQITDSRYPLPI